jgi:uncharacterized protein (TIGR02145 family)
MNKQILLTLTASLVLAWNAIGQVPSYVPTDGLVGYWPFNGNANDESGNGNNGVVNGPTLTTDRFGTANSAYYFNGGEQRIVTDSATLPNAPGSFSISLWVKNEGGTGGEIICDRRSNYNNKFRLQIMKNSPTQPVSFSTYYQDKSYDLIKGSFDKVTWHHIVAIGDFEKKELRLYINGKEVGRIPDYHFAELMNPTTIGANLGPFNLNDQAIVGKIDDIGIWNRTLTESEINQLYKSEIISSCLPDYIPKNGLVGYWPFCGNANDESGNGNHGRANGVTQVKDRFGKENSAFYFDGSDDWIEIANGANIIDTSFTIHVWLNESTITSNKRILSFERRGAPDGHQFRLSIGEGVGVVDDGKVYFFAGINGVGSLNWINGYNLKTIDKLKSDTWQSITITKIGRTYKLYRNGVLESEAEANANLNFRSNPNSILIGAVFDAFVNNPWDSFHGSLDDIGIWNRALSPEEVKRLYVVATVPCLPSYVPTDGLVGYWPFCGNANDESGNGNDGVVNGATLTTDRFGNKNNSYKFDGNSWIQVQDDNSLDLTDNITLSAWFKIDSNMINQGIIGKGGQNPNQTGYGILLNVLNPLQSGFVLQNLPTFIAQEAYITNNIAGAWHQIVGTYNGITMHTYLDGKLLTSKNTNIVLSKSDSNLFFGKELNDLRYYSGLLDDIGIWNRALTEKEVQQLYNNSKPFYCDIDSLLNPAITYGSVSDYDGNTYPTVKINGREWMAQNLRTTRFANGDQIPNVPDGNQWISMTSSAWAYYLNDSLYNCPFGKLYNWFALRDERNICPEGWHVMTADDWADLMNGVSNHKDWLNSSIGWGQNVKYKNESGMSMIPGGMRGNWDGGAGEINKFLALNETAWFGQPNANPYHHAISLNNGYQFLTGAFGYNYSNFFTAVTGTSVRCVQNKQKECDLIQGISPGIIQALEGSTVKISAKMNEIGGILRWQVANQYQSWMEANVNNGIKYKGSDTPELTVRNINIGDNLLRLRLIASKGACTDTSEVAVILVQDTCFFTLTDTILTTVTDTLVIDVVLSSTTDPSGTSIKVYPNPTSSQLVIETGNASLLTGYTMTITNGAGATVWTEAVSQPLYSLDLSGWGGKGLYYITLTDPQGKVITTRKIVLQ